MPKFNAKPYRERKAHDLLLLAQLLGQFEVCEDVSPIHSAAFDCRESSDRHWGYSLENLLFRIGYLDGAVPRGLTDLVLRLSVEVRGRYPQAANDCDPFDSLGIDLVISGRSFAAGGSCEHIASWHFDRHITGDTPSTSADAHPLYHFQYGGRRMNNVRLGGTLLLNEPRFMYPPMDAILAIDFVLANFRPQKWEELRSDGTYRNRIDEAYHFYWRPFFERVAGFWAPSTQEGASIACSLCPFLLSKPNSSASLGTDLQRSKHRSQVRKGPTR